MYIYISRLLRVIEEERYLWREEKIDRGTVSE